MAETGWWGVYDYKSRIWRCENQRSNYDDFTGKLIIYPCREAAQAHVDMLERFVNEENRCYEAREFGVTNDP